jgi:hypothetical protein
VTQPIHVSKVGDIPDTPHWAIVTCSSTHVPGDERSRTSPGHGYGPHTVTSVRYEAYTDEQAWIEEIKRLETKARQFGGSSTPYTALAVTPAKVTVNVQVQVKRNV